jgi:hypothetical protein
LVKVAPLPLANIWPGEKLRIGKDGGQGMAKIVGDEGDDAVRGGKRLQNWKIPSPAPQRSRRQ